jgi:hypothetical protein
VFLTFGFKQTPQRDARTVHLVLKLT